MFAYINKVIRQYGIDSEAERKLLRRENVNAIDKLIIYAYIQLYITAHTNALQIGLNPNIFSS